MKTQRSEKLIQKLENKQKKIDEVTEELSRLHFESNKLVNKLKEEQDTFQEKHEGKTVRNFFSTRAGAKFKAENKRRYKNYKKSPPGAFNSDVIEDGDTVEITNTYKSKKYGNLQGRQGTVQRQSNTFVYLDIPGIPDEIPRGKGNVTLIAKGNQVFGSSSEGSDTSFGAVSSTSHISSFASAKDHTKY